jgi:ribosomal protein S18 acetylase RimI-like enzyme
MPIMLREIVQNDITTVVRLMRAFAEYENLSEYCTVTEKRLGDVMFGDDAFVEGLIAFDGDVAIGYALFYPGFSTFRGERSLFLEDIYISEEHRRNGLGERMLREIARRAKQRGCERMDFHVLESNAAAINFYLKHGAEKNAGESHFKFASEVFAGLAS